MKRSPETRTETRDVAPLSTRGALGTLNEKRRTVEVMFSSGARVHRPSWYGNGSYEELSMAPDAVRLGRLNGGAPVLAGHQRGVDNVIGVVESARLENGKGYATLRFAKAEDDPRADQIFRKIRDGVITGVSIGYRVFKAEKVEDGSTTIPVFRATEWEPFEISPVDVPAEQGAGFRSERSDSSTNQCVFVTRQENAVENETQNQTAVAAERERAHGIMSAVRKAKLGNELAEAMIRDGVTLDKAREQILDAVATRSEQTPTDHHIGSGLEVGETSHEKFMRGAEASILSRAGAVPMLLAVTAAVQKGQVSSPGVRSAFKNFNVDDGGEFQSYSYRELARATLDRRGVRTTGMSADQIVGKALTYRSGDFFARDNGSQNTSSDFATLLENALGKILLGNYALASDTWRKFCGTDTVNDFRTASRYRTGSFGVLDEIGESAEYKQKAIPDGSKYTLAVKTYGNKIAISRQAIVNDDMAAIVDTMGKFGRAAGLSIEKAAYDLIGQNGGLGPTQADTNPFMHSSRGNVNGTGSAIGAAGLDADRIVLAKQKDLNASEYLGLKPAVLLVPTDLGGQARVINGARYDVTAGTAFETPNKVFGLFREVVDSPRLAGTRRYLFADPGEVAAFVVTFLNGLQAPFMEQKLGWDIDGTEIRVRIDYGVSAADSKGVVTNAGV